MQSILEHDMTDRRAAVAPNGARNKRVPIQQSYSNMFGELCAVRCTERYSDVLSTFSPNREHPSGEETMFLCPMWEGEIMEELQAGPLIHS